MKALFEPTGGVIRVIPSGKFGDPYVFVAHATLVKPWLFLRGVETMGPHPHRTASAIRAWCKIHGFDMVGWEHKGRTWYWHRIKKGRAASEPPKPTVRRPEYSWADGELTTRLGSCRFTPIEADIVDHLLRHQKSFQPAERIAERIWAIADEPSDPGGTVRVHMARIRRKAKPVGIEVESHTGFGYKIYLPNS